MNKYFDKKIIASCFVGASMAVAFGGGLVMTVKGMLTNAVS